MSLGLMATSSGAPWTTGSTEVLHLTLGLPAIPRDGTAIRDAGQVCLCSMRPPNLPSILGHIVPRRDIVAGFEAIMAAQP
jgi:hypothetical protein